MHLEKKCLNKFIHRIQSLFYTVCLTDNSNLWTRLYFKHIFQKVTSGLYFNLTSGDLFTNRQLKALKKILIFLGTY